MKRRTFEGMVAYFNRTVADMDIPRKYKMELLGMITAILQKHDEEVRRWVPCSERLPEKEGNYLITAQPTYNHAKDIRIAHWSSRWVGYVKSEIIAWMPLPQPYTEETNA